MGLVFTAVVYLSSYVSLVLVAICLACGLYYLAELAEEHTSTTKLMMGFAIAVVLAVHVLFLVFEDLPINAIAIGIAAHLSYAWQLQSFPRMDMLSAPFLTSLGMLAASNFLWGRHFLAHYHQLTRVLCFMLFSVWLVPAGFFVSLGVNESMLPGRLVSSAGEFFPDGSTRSKNKSGLLSAFSFMQEKRDGMMPSVSKRV